jgi:hypothetical protein
MVIPEIVKYHISCFWDSEFKNLEYKQEKFNDETSLAKWLELGFANKFTGDMCDMGLVQPVWNSKFIEIFSNKGWKNIGTSYYRMMPGTILPTHSDLYKKYIQLFDLVGKEHCIRRAIVFLENWQSGHYAEYNNVAFTGWQAGDTIEWNYDTPHMAANVGYTPRYTLQITGHV